MSETGGSLEIVAFTDRGRVRSRNEDSVGVDHALGAAVVADGMGGLPDGDVASREAVRTILSYLGEAGPPVGRAALETALQRANERIRARAHSSGTIMGTTAVALAFDGTTCRVVHVGDSRAYRFRHGAGLSLVTRDHSMVQDMVSRGLLTPQAARRSPSRNIITRAIGLEPAFEADCVEFVLEPGELVLLCSDGLWDMLEDEHIAGLLTGCGTGEAALQRCVHSLVQAANEAGGLDNISVVLARR